MSTFVHSATTEKDLVYNQPVFSKDGLSNEQHTLRAGVSGLSYEVYIDFDYAMVTSVFLI